MFSNIPVELWTMLSTGLLSWVGTLTTNAMENRRQLFEMSMAKGKLQEKATQSARDFKGWEFTRRFLAISAMLGFLWPMFAPVFFPWVNVTTGWTEWAGGFWFFTEAQEVFKWHTVSGGIVYNPFHNHILAAVFGFFFGNQIGKVRR